MAQRITELPDPRRTSIRRSATRSSRSIARSRTRRSTPPTIISTSSAPRNRSRAPPRRCGCGRGPSRSTAWWKNRRKLARRSHPQDAVGRTALPHRCVEAWGMAIRGPGSRFQSSSNSPSPPRPPNTCGWKPSSIRIWRPGSAQAGIRGLISKASHGRGHERPRLPGHRRLWQAGVEVSRRAPAAGAAVKYGFKSIKSITRVDVYGPAAKTFWKPFRRVRIRLLGEHQSAGLPSALEPGHRAGDRDQRRRPTLLFNATANTSPISIRT